MKTRHLPLRKCRSTVNHFKASICHYQARTQGFEKGGYIVKNFPLNFWHFNVKLFFSHDSVQE